MATQNDMNFVFAELNALSDKISHAYATQEVGNSTRFLNQYFHILRQGHAHGIIPDEELTQYVRQWKDEVMRLANISPNSAFTAAYLAKKSCARGEEGLACDILIINTVCCCINKLATPALYFYQTLTPNMPFEQAIPYLKSVVDVMVTTAPYFHSQNLQDTFFESMTVFENMLFKHFVAPTTRYEFVKKIRDWADDQKPNCGALLTRMDEILGDTKYLPDGRGILLNELEEQADDIARESAEWFSKKPVNIASAFAIQAGVAVELADIYKKIETSLNDGCYQGAEDYLCELFHNLMADAEEGDEDDPQVPEEDVSTYSYFLKAADRLSSVAIVHGTRLAYRCIMAMEEEGGASDELMATVYGFALPAISSLESQDSQYTKIAKELYKVIMKRSSEFEEIGNTEDIFECAAIGYRQCLVQMAPVSRYDEISELSAWLDERECPSPFLKDFVDELMTMAELYGNNRGIPFEEDFPEPVHIETVHPLRGNNFAPR